ncbi:MAG: hypothetical protein JST59_18740 [Actinobacteria bacterium]|nr:hypothetical protein [Actinomycetota bacterium]
MSDEQQLERLEKKVDDGFAETRAEFRAVRAELRGEVGSIQRSIQAMWLTMILGFAAIIVQQHL